MTSYEALAETVRSPRECDCPEWVLRCAHLDDQWIALHESPTGGVWATCQGSGTPEYLPYDTGHASRHHGFASLDKNEVVAAFYAAEEQLLRGGAA